MTGRIILAWADAHFKRIGRWPTYRSGPVFDAPGQDWSAIDKCLEYGGSGLPGGSSLAYLLARHRGFVKGRQRSRLSFKLILVWADRHRMRTGSYPTKRSGRVTGVRGESWWKVDRALQKGDRGLRGGSSLEQLLSKHRGKALERTPANPLEIDQILTWVDEHRERTGFWPKIKTGPVNGQPSETWSRIDSALRYGLRGLPDGSSLSQLLIKKRGKIFRERRRNLTVSQLLDWADRHRERTGNWPKQQAGPIHDVPGETWRKIDEALRKGAGGLPGGSSLPALLAQHRGRRHMGRLPRLTIPMILAWADKHHQRTDRWPSDDSGPVHDVPDESWRNIAAALQRGGRGLGGTRTLSELLAKRRARMPSQLKPRMSVGQILAWADRHRALTKIWPTPSSGKVLDAPENTWNAINNALIEGYRCLPGGSSLARLLAEKRGRLVRIYAPRVTVKDVLRWADEHRRRTGDWPLTRSGTIECAPYEVWSNIDHALRIGCRGFKGGSSLARLLYKYRGRRSKGLRIPKPKMSPPLGQRAWKKRKQEERARTRSTSHH